MQHLHTRYNRWLILLVGVTLTIASIARGGGIEVPMQDAKAAGEADAFTAQADDPSAIFYNPAGLTQIQGTQISVGRITYSRNSISRATMVRMREWAFRRCFRMFTSRATWGRTTGDLVSA